MHFKISPLRHKMTGNEIPIKFVYKHMQSSVYSKADQNLSYASSYKLKCATYLALAFWIKQGIYHARFKFEDT